MLRLKMFKSADDKEKSYTRDQVNTERMDITLPAAGEKVVR